ncbi:hypothetical protein GE09DRAFT_1270658 [Coniochaeta sp. 2T2.1]|nr:hypothetical protein GE09DRAFT_1270658 [Coniochaeta sp. 2T2.1]
MSTDLSRSPRKWTQDQVRFVLEKLRGPKQPYKDIARLCNEQFPNAPNEIDAEHVKYIKSKYEALPVAGSFQATRHATRRTNTILVSKTILRIPSSKIKPSLQPRRSPVTRCPGPTTTGWMDITRDVVLMVVTPMMMMEELRCLQWRLSATADSPQSSPQHTTTTTTHIQDLLPTDATKKIASPPPTPTTTNSLHTIETYYTGAPHNSHTLSLPTMTCIAEHTPTSTFIWRDDVDSTLWVTKPNPVTSLGQLTPLPLADPFYRDFLRTITPRPKHEPPPCVFDPVTREMETNLMYVLDPAREEAFTPAGEKGFEKGIIWRLYQKKGLRGLGSRRRGDRNAVYVAMWRRDKVRRPRGKGEIEDRGERVLRERVLAYAEEAAERDERLQAEEDEEGEEGQEGEEEEEEEDASDDVGETCGREPDLGPLSRIMSWLRG